MNNQQIHIDTPNDIRIHTNVLVVYMTAPQIVQSAAHVSDLDRQRLLYDIIKGCSNWLKGRLRYSLPMYSVSEEFEPSSTGGTLTLIIGLTAEESHD